VATLCFFWFVAGRVCAKLRRASFLPTMSISGASSAFEPERSMGDKKLDSFPGPLSRPTRVIIADPYPVIVHGVRTMVEDDPQFQVVAGARTMPSFQKKVISERPEVGLVDWFMASQDLATTTSLLNFGLHSTSIVFLTVSENSPEKQEMLRLGARAFLSKWSSARKLRTAVLKASDGPPPQKNAAVGAALANGLPMPASTDAERRITRLTRRECQLLPLVCSGLKNKDIALQLGVAESTVWHHLTAIFTKLQVEDRLGLATFAYSHGLTHPDAPPRRAEDAGIPPRASTIGQRERSLHG
jgi:two-component system, NarL family, nitrate/nitrite response regulator NarL